jgi:dTDP-4-dehydrorhamnose 3,5-epimerase
MITLILGNRFFDQRGCIRYNNDFDMSNIKRMYFIESPKNLVRAWQGHRSESKWFYVVSGSFEFQIVNIDDHSDREEVILNSKYDQILKIDAGNYNGFKALEDDSRLMVFSDKYITESSNDDYRLSINYLKW